MIEGNCVVKEYEGKKRGKFGIWNETTGKWIGLSEWDRLDMEYDGSQEFAEDMLDAIRDEQAGLVRCNGHLHFGPQREFYLFKDQVYAAPLRNPIDVAGYRQGGRHHCSVDVWPQVYERLIQQEEESAAARAAEEIVIEAARAD